MSVYCTNNVKCTIQQQIVIKYNDRVWQVACCVDVIISAV